MEKTLLNVDPLKFNHNWNIKKELEIMESAIYTDPVSSSKGSGPSKPGSSSTLEPEASSWDDICKKSARESRIWQ